MWNDYWANAKPESPQPEDYFKWLWDNWVADKRMKWAYRRTLNDADLKKVGSFAERYKIDVEYWI